MTMQIRIPDKGRTENGWINIERDMGHFFREFVREAVMSIPEDCIVPKPSDEEIHKFIKSVTGLILRSEEGKLEPAEVDKEIAEWEPGLASAFKHYLCLIMFRKYVIWRRDLLPYRPVPRVPKPEEKPQEEKKSE